MGKIRINELARELEIKPGVIIKMLSAVGITESKTHSSSIEKEQAGRVRRHFGRLVEVEATPPPRGPKPVLAVAKSPAKAQSAPQTSSAPPASKPSETQLSPDALAKDGGPPAPTVESGESEPAESAPVRPLFQPLRPPLTSEAAVRPPLVSTAPPTPTIQPGPKKKPAAEPPVQPTIQPTVQKRAAAKPVAPAKPPVRPAKPPAVQAKPVPAPKPGQILTGPRQPLPPRAAEPKRQTVLPGQPLMKPAPKAPSLPRPPVQRQQRRTPPPPRQAAAPTAMRPIVGKPAARPVVPPRPDLVARLQQQTKVPGQPQQPRPGMPQRGPVPGQPIYRGPIRPGQPIMRGPGAPGRRRGQHPTSVRVEPQGPMPPSPTRRHQTKPGGRAGQRERDRDREGRQRTPMPRRQPEVFAVNKEITISDGITVKELSEKLGIKASLVIKKLVERRIFATINQALDTKLAEELSSVFGAATTKMSFEEESVQEMEQAEASEDLQRRPPVVTVMGHVDHGKTSLLDAIRSTSVAEREAGGITQHIGAYHVEHKGNKIVFIDTPGHEAFTRMRARGAKVTDIVILVVAADDGVMPQTLEAIDHAKAADAPIIVAINKIDRPDANPDRVKQQLADRNLLAEDWGGDVVMVPVSAVTKEGIELLLEMIGLVAELQDLKANEARPALGTVLEAELDRGRGPVATVLVRNGTLRVGDHFICGAVFGRVRAMFDDRAEAVKEAGPSMPVEVIGLNTVPEVGDTYQVVTDTVKAKQIVIYREAKAREVAMAKGARLTLDKLHEQLREGETKELNVILKADVGGSAEVVTDTLEKLSNEKVKVNVISKGVGAITDSDVLLATASNAVIIGFNVRPERSATHLADQEKIDIRLHTIIYELTDEVKKAMTGLLEPVFKEVFRGRAEVQQVFRVTKVGTIAGCQVQEGSLTRDGKIRLLRDNVVVHTGKIESLKRFKDDASEVKTGFECGVGLENFNDIKPGDVIEAFVMERVATEVFA